MKVCERMFLQCFKPYVDRFLDPLQFAYQSGRSCEDAILVFLDRLYSHLERTRYGNSARVMVFYFSSAFNTIQPHVLANKLLNMMVPAGFVRWILDYLTNRSQYVRLSHSCRSRVIQSNTGAPQGTVLAPFLFALCNSDCKFSEKDCNLVKFADDTAMTGLIVGHDDRAYLHQLDSFVNYCDSNFLDLNVAKTKEIITDFRKNSVLPPPVFIKGTEVKHISSYKYLGVVMNNKLTWDDHVDVTIKKLHSRLYFVRKLSTFNLCSEILKIFYDAL
ncbi:hypothetical protein HOLleu_14205 [Holothuria leucospilota]|uniref:Reverse transcriptase domain-containing protein n=1 Tax=Holothuria leucospilota TaxID=206669 RepID=A0A9Q1HCA2_HOLLE|nr:hypothetical protein HOLleu_14205 [Holothuria leucospilota]